MHLSLRRALRLHSRFIRLSLAASIAGIAVAAPAWGEEMREAVSVDFKALEILESEGSLFHHLPAPDKGLRSRLHVPGLPSGQKPLAPPSLKKPRALKKPHTRGGPPPNAQPKHLTSPSIEIKAQRSPSAPQRSQTLKKSPYKNPSIRTVKEVKPHTDSLNFAPADLSLAFHPNEVQLPEAARKHLDTLARDMLKEQHRQARLMSYASGSQTNPAKARRTSLARALAIRSYLLKKGVQSNRIGLRALGKQAPDGKKDRVDIVLTPP